MLSRAEKHRLYSVIVGAKHVEDEAKGRRELNPPAKDFTISTLMWLAVRLRELNEELEKQHAKQK